jgi:hypothetical protein
LGALVEEQLLVLLETEATREVQEVARQSGKIGVVVDDAAVVEALDIAVDDIAWVHETLLYCFLIYEGQA